MTKIYNRLHTPNKKTALTMISAVFFVFLDIFLKNFAIKNLENSDIFLLGNFLKLSLAKNTGIAFSIPLPTLFLSIFIGTIIILLIGFYIKELKNKNEQHVIPLTFILIGAIMNFVDRIRFGYVIDYFNLKWFTVFNVADCLIVGGVMIYFSIEIFNKRYGGFEN